MSQDASPELLKRAVGLLARREHSRAELAAKLRRKAGTPPAEVDAVLDTLERNKYLSDRRFAESYVRSRSGQWGRLRIATELKKRGVDEQLVAAALDAGLDDEPARALAVLRKKHPGPLARHSKEALRCQRFLAMRGFAGDAIKKAFAMHAQPDEQP